MTLSWNQIRSNAKKFSKEWANAHYEKGETQPFYEKFFEIFGQRRRSVAVYERKVSMLGRNHGFIDLFWPGMLLVEQKSAGKDLEAAAVQADDYILALKERERPRYRLVCDFQNFTLADLETRQVHKFSLEDLDKNIRLFDFIAGRQQQIYRDQDPVNIKAAIKMSNLHRLLEETGYQGRDLERFLVRIMFCLFADDTGIFEPDTFLRYMEDRTNPDGSDTGTHLIEIFQILDTPIAKRSTVLDEDLAALPYVNGQLFTDSVRIPAFTAAMRQALLDCCYFNWTAVSPALFGSLFQTVMMPEEQRQEGAHYTSERNILKTIRPLFLDELHAEFEKIRSERGTQRQSKLVAFHDKISKLTFFDPACGCGNFLILAYRELRELELELLNTIYPKDSLGNRQGLLDISRLSKLDVDRFYGIEINEFPARIAETALWLTDHQMNMKLGDIFGQAFARLPLKATPHIHHANALNCNWADVIPPQNCSYILGNPPFVGKAQRDKDQQNDMKLIFGTKDGASDLDYVACWFRKAAEYIQTTNCEVAFVSTNSITQGEQVALLWERLISDLNIKINFAHRTFKWTLDARAVKGMKIASVLVVIVGFSLKEKTEKIIFEYETLTSDPQSISANNISPYLADAPNLFVKSRRNKLQTFAPEIKFGSMPNDGQHLLLDPIEKESFLAQEPGAANFIRPILGSKEFINGIDRYCLWLKDCSPDVMRKLPLLMSKVEDVRKARIASSRPATNKLASTPWLFGEDRQPSSNYLAIPEVSSERREYIPLGFLKKDVIASNKLYTLSNGTLFHFGILSSAMHMAWIRTVSGRLKNDYQYSSGVVYNNFPWPNTTKEQEVDIAQKAQIVLDIRQNFPQSTLADLYDPNTMPVALRQAHSDLDKTVDRAYRKNPFKNELERIQLLFSMYQALIEPLTANLIQVKRRKKTSSN